MWYLGKKKVQKSEHNKKSKREKEKMKKGMQEKSDMYEKRWKREEKGRMKVWLDNRKGDIKKERKN